MRRSRSLDLDRPETAGFAVSTRGALLFSSPPRCCLNSLGRMAGRTDAECLSLPRGGRKVPPSAFPSPFPPAFFCEEERF